MIRNMWVLTKGLQLMNKSRKLPDNSESEISQKEEKEDTKIHLLQM